MLTNAQKERPILLGVHLSWAFDNYAQADLEYAPEVQLKMLEGYLGRLERFLVNVVTKEWAVLLTSLDASPCLLETYHYTIKDRVAHLFSKFQRFFFKISKFRNVYNFVEHNAGDACETMRFNQVLFDSDPKLHIIGGFESGCLSNTVNRLKRRVDLVKIPDLIFDENFDDDYKRL